MEIPSAIDLTQHSKKLSTPEIRVWCHPHFIKKSGEDYYRVFDSFKQAMDFIKEHKEAECIPLIAFKGHELNIFAEGIKWARRKKKPKKRS